MDITPLFTRGRGKVCVYSILPRPHLWECVGYVVVNFGIDILLILDLVLWKLIVFFSRKSKMIVLENWLVFEGQ